MNWLEITLNTEREQLDGVCSALEALGVSGLVINDEEQVKSFLETERQYWDYVDDDVLKRVEGVCSVQFYLEDSEEGERELERIKSRLPGDYALKKVRDEDWENNWKEYYKPIETGRRLIIVPEWESCGDTDRTVLRLDPGLIFGTGAHATTRMCLEAAEELCPKTVLDLGCGSGILAIAALLLGAESAVCCDIDEKARKVVLENAALNGIGPERISVYSGDIVNDEGISHRIEGAYDVVFANIVADVIIALAGKVPSLLSETGTFVCSGIIEGRQYEVERAITGAGLKISGHRELDGWHCYTARL